jgi:Zn-dependent peptidase ImmA (M78 family)
MAQTVSGINPEILAWARRRAGLSVAEVADRLKKNPAVIEGWERGESAPTYVQLETLAYKVFRRPVALFFFPEPPDEPSPERFFRTLPRPEADDLSADTRYKVREAHAFQLSLYELNGDTNPAERKIFDDITVSSQDSAPEVAATVRQYLGVEVETRSQWSSPSEWFRECRRLVEDAGIYVFKNSFKQNEVSGFCLYDPVFPIIYINNSTAAARQIFTLFHELAHILLHTSGVTKLHDEYIGTLASEERRIEVFCNQFAAELLVPEEDFQVRVGELPPDVELINELARVYKVSRETILRRFLDLGRVSSEVYEEMTGQWNQEYESRSKGSGGDYYATRASYLGDKYLELAFSRYYQGAISEQRLSELLGVKARNIPTLEQRYLGRASG